MLFPEVFNFSLPDSPSQRLRLGNLPCDSMALVLKEIAEKQKGITLVVTPDTTTANRLEAALKFFLPRLNY